MPIVLLVVALVVVGVVVAVVMKGKGGGAAETAASKGAATRASSAAQSDLVSIDDRLGASKPSPSDQPSSSDRPTPVAPARPLLAPHPEPTDDVPAPSWVEPDAIGEPDPALDEEPVLVAEPVLLPEPEMELAAEDDHAEDLPDVAAVIATDDPEVERTAGPMPESELAPIVEPAPIAEPVAEAPSLPTSVAAAEVVADADAPSAFADDEDDGDDEDEVFDRFGRPGTRAKGPDDLLSVPMADLAAGKLKLTAAASLPDVAAPSHATPAVVAADEAGRSDQPEAAADEAAELTGTLGLPEPVAPLDAPALAEVGDGAAPVSVEAVAQNESPEPEAEAEIEVLPEVSLDTVEAEEVSVDEVALDAVAVDDDATTIELDAVEEVGAVAASAPALDPVDHVLAALISRAKDRKVGIAQVAAELVDQANLEDREVEEVLAELVGITAGGDATSEAAPGRETELTFFNESVPRRPGQLLDFANLTKQEKKLALVRVLCLLVALQEDEKLRPRETPTAADADDSSKSWPLVRAVWPVKSSSPEVADENLPARASRKRLARQR